MTHAAPTALPRHAGSLSGILSGALARLPGLALCVVVVLAATGLEKMERHVLGRTPLEGLVLAILVGAGVRTAWTPGPLWRPGIDVSAKLVLEVAVVLLGASLSAATLAAAGPALILGIAAMVALAIGVSYGLCRGLGLPGRMAVLVACGNSICGNSAIAAVAPVIGADGEEVAAAIAFTAVLGVGVVLGLPVLGGALHLGPARFGAFAGLTVYAVPQVLAAAAPMGPPAVQVGTFVKLVRVLMLGPVCLVLSLFSPQGAATQGAPMQGAPMQGAPMQGAGRFAPHKLVPWFILGFLAMAAARSAGVIPPAALPVLAKAAGLMTVLSMAALGLGTDLRALVQAGGRVVLAVVGSLAALGLVAFALINLLHVG